MARTPKKNKPLPQKRIHQTDPTNAGNTSAQKVELTLIRRQFYTLKGELRKLTKEKYQNFFKIEKEVSRDLIIGDFENIVRRFFELENSKDKKIVFEGKDYNSIFLDQLHKPRVHRRKKKKASKAIRLLEENIRKYIFRRRFQRFKHTLIRLQSIFRGHIVRQSTIKAQVLERSPSLEKNTIEPNLAIRILQKKIRDFISKRRFQRFKSTLIEFNTLKQPNLLYGLHPHHKPHTVPRSPNISPTRSICMRAKELAATGHANPKATFFITKDALKNIASYLQLQHNQKRISFVLSNNFISHSEQDSKAIALSNHTSSQVQLSIPRKTLETFVNALLKNSDQNAISFAFGPINVALNSFQNLQLPHQDRRAITPLTAITDYASPQVKLSIPRELRAFSKAHTPIQEYYYGDHDYQTPMTHNEVRRVLKANNLAAKFEGAAQISMSPVVTDSNPAPKTKAPSANKFKYIALSVMFFGVLGFACFRYWDVISAFSVKAGAAILSIGTLKLTLIGVLALATSTLLYKTFAGTKEKITVDRNDSASPSQTFSSNDKQRITTTTPTEISTMTHRISNGCDSFISSVIGDNTV